MKAQFEKKPSKRKTHRKEVHEGKKPETTKTLLEDSNGKWNLLQKTKGTFSAARGNQRVSRVDVSQKFAL